MLSAIGSAILGILTGKAGERIGGAVSKATELAAVAATIGGLVAWLQANGQDVAVQLTLTWSELAFLSVALGPAVYIAVRLVHRAPPPG